MSKVIISDASCLIALDRINKLEILAKIFGTIVTTPEVQSEFGNTLPGWISIIEAKDQVRKNDLNKLVDLGEASAISLAIESVGATLIIDEKKGRELALKLNLKIIGTIRVLLLAKQKGVIPKIKPLLVELEKNHFRFSKSLIIKVLEEAQEI